MTKRSSDLAPGLRFGNWTVLANAERRNGRTRLVCRCVCGVERNLDRKNVVLGGSKGCGCTRSGNYKATRRARAKPVLERIYSRVVIDPLTGCHNWTGARGHMGHGVITISDEAGRRQVRVHRVTYELAIGPIPDGLVLDHLCRNPPCCNPDHLEPVTLGENTMRGENPAARRKRQTHCIRGHAFTPENTIVHPTKGWRNCRTCAPLRQAKYRARRKRRYVAEAVQ